MEQSPPSTPRYGCSPIPLLAFTVGAIDGYAQQKFSCEDLDPDTISTLIQYAYNHPMIKYSPLVLHLAISVTSLVIMRGVMSFNDRYNIPIKLRDIHTNLPISPKEAQNNAIKRSTYGPSITLAVTWSGHFAGRILASIDHGQTL